MVEMVFFLGRNLLRKEIKMLISCLNKENSVSALVSYNVFKNSICFYINIEVVNYLLLCL